MPKVEFVFLFGFALLLALLVFFAFDPIEKQKEQNDTAFKDTASQILKSLENFTQKNGRLPWSNNFVSDNPYPALAWTTANSSQIGICKDVDCLLQGELVKEKFLDPLILKEKVSEIYLGKGAGVQKAIFACFIPQSKKERKNLSQLYSLEIQNPLSPQNPVACDENINWNISPCYICINK